MRIEIESHMNAHAVGTSFLIPIPSRYDNSNGAEISTNVILRILS